MKLTTKSLADCCCTISDGDHLPPPKAENGIPFITISNITENNHISFNDVMYVPEDYYNNLPASKKARKDDILYSVVGSFGKPVYIREDKKFVFQRHIAILKTNDTVNGKYLYYAMLNPYFFKRIDKIAIGCSQRTVTLDALRNLSIDLPNMEVQNSIVAVLSAIDKKIDVNIEINDNLQQQLQTLYNYWFTQFDFPDNNGKPYYSSGGRMEYNKVIGRNIPRGWKVESVTTNSITSIIKPGVQLFTTKTYLATADVIGTAISGGNQIEYATRESRANMQPTEYSVWFAKMKNSVKHLYLNSAMSPIIQNTILSTGFCGLQCDEVCFEYVASYIEHSYFESIKNKLAHGATQEAVNNDDMDSIPMVIPPTNILQVYHEHTKCLYTQISKNICENKELMHLRNWLLPMLMNGQATVAD